MPEKTPEMEAAELMSRVHVSTNGLRGATEASERAIAAALRAAHDAGRAEALKEVKTAIREEVKAILDRMALARCPHCGREVFDAERLRKLKEAQP